MKRFILPRQVCEAIIICQIILASSHLMFRHKNIKAGVVSLVANQFRPPIVRSRNGNVQCMGETFSQLETIQSFAAADDLVERYLS